MNFKIFLIAFLFPIIARAQGIEVGLASCYFNGQGLMEDEYAIAYLHQVDPTGECPSERRFCSNGQMSGSYEYSTCTQANLNCTFNGQTVLNGSSVLAYQNTGGPTCVSEMRTCTNGQLSGSYSHADCRVDAPKACLFNGKSVPHGQTLLTFQNSSVGYGETCLSESRTCLDGVMSGSYAFESCEVGQAASCLFDGKVLNHGESATAYNSSSVPFGQTCSSESRTCNNGNLSGSFSFSSCTPGQAASCLFDGRTLVHGEVVKAFQNSSVAYGSSCVEETRACNNGSLSGSYTFSSCTAGQPESCLFNGRTVAHGEVVKAFQNSSVAHGASCVEQSRTCNNGSLSGSYTFPSCAVDGPKSCSFNGQTLAHGQTVIAFLSSSVGYGSSCQQQVRKCDNGVLSGNYTFGSCSADQPKACLFDGKTIAHGGNVKAYQNSNAPYGSSCNAETRECNNGILSGSFSYGSCSVGAAQSCLFDGKTIAHGQTIKAFGASSVPFGQKCSSQDRTCNNGVLTGSFEFPSCAVGVAASCKFNGQTIPHGGNVVAFKTSTAVKEPVKEQKTCKNWIFCLIDKIIHVAEDKMYEQHPNLPHDPKLHHFVHGKLHSLCKGGHKPGDEVTVCESEVRVCTNGKLSGTFEYATCTAQTTPKSCKLKDRTIAHGESITAYKEKRSCHGTKCVFQKRTCKDGKLTGTFTELTCEVEKNPWKIRDQKKDDKKDNKLSWLKR